MATNEQLISAAQRLDTLLPAAERGEPAALAEARSLLTTLEVNVAQAATLTGLSQGELQGRIDAARARADAVEAGTTPPAGATAGPTSKTVSETPEGTTTTIITTTQPPLSPEERQLLKSQQELLDLQLKDLRRQNELLATIFPDLQGTLKASTEFAQAQMAFETKRLEALTPLVRLQTEELSKQLPLMTQLFQSQLTAATQELEMGVKRLESADVEIAAAKKSESIRDKLLADLGETPEQATTRKAAEARIQADLTGGAILTPAEQATLDRIFGPIEARGTEELTRFAEELAAGRGLKTTDTPIGQTVLPEVRKFQESLGGARAEASLALRERNRAFAEGVREFQENLRENALRNRVALTGRPAPVTGATNIPGFGPTSLVGPQGVSIPGFPSVGGNAAQTLATGFQAFQKPVVGGQVTPFQATPEPTFAQNFGAVAGPLATALLAGFPILNKIFKLGF